jgi:hypothetical protein
MRARDHAIALLALQPGSNSIARCARRHRPAGVRAPSLRSARATATASGFVAPAWLEPRGPSDVLASVGFAWHETGLAIKRLADRRWIASPVIGFATRTPLRTAVALASAAALAPIGDRVAIA